MQRYHFLVGIGGGAGGAAFLIGTSCGLVGSRRGTVAGFVGGVGGFGGVGF